MNKLLYILRNYFFLLPLLCLVSCNTIKFTPYELPPAQVGKQYYAQVEITGGKASIAYLDWEITPSNALAIETIKISGFVRYNNFKIYGVPLKNEDIKIELLGFTYGTSSPGKSFRKTYTIKVTKE